jgi:replicative DNA helicase
MENNNFANYATVSVADTECERYVIGTALNYGNYMYEAMETLTDDSFTDARCRECWSLMVSLANDGETIDIVTVTAKTMQTGSRITAADVAEMSDKVLSSTFTDNVGRLHELELRRRLKTVGIRIQQLSLNELTPVDEALTKSRELIDNSMNDEKSHVLTLTDTLASFNQSLKDRLSGKTKAGTRTGFARLDERGGFHGGDLIIIAGCTSQGKTALATTITMNAMQAGCKVAYYSLEMTGEQLTARIVSMKSEVSASVITYGTPSDYDMEKIRAASESLNKSNLFFDDNSTSGIDSIIGSIRRMRMRHSIGGVIVDYLQILNVNMKGTASKEQQMADVARRLKNLAKELHIWVVALSQLNRDRENPEPSIDRLRDSGQIAEAADTVMLVYRPEYYGRNFPKPFQDKDTHNAALIDVCKGRNTGTMKFVCHFVPELTLFLDGGVGRQVKNEDEEPF